MTCPRCSANYRTVGQLAAHLVEVHLVGAAEALAEARAAAGAVSRPVGGPAHEAGSVAASGRSTTRGTTTLPDREVPMPTSKDCKLCARKAPEKCKWHRAPTNSHARTRGGRPQRRRRSMRSPNGAGSLAAQIAALRTVVDRGRAAEAELREIAKLVKG